MAKKSSKVKKNKTVIRKKATVKAIKTNTIKIPSDLYKNLKKELKERHQSIEQFLKDVLFHNENKTIPKKVAEHVEYEWNTPQPNEEIIVKPFPEEEIVIQPPTNFHQTPPPSNQSQSSSNEKTAPYRIAGVIRIRNSANKVQGVHLQIIPSNDVARTVTTNNNGYWEVNGLTASQVEVKIADQLGFTFDPPDFTLNALHSHMEIIAVPIAQKQSQTEAPKQETPNKQEAPKQEESKQEAQSTSNTSKPLIDSIPLATLYPVLEQMNFLSSRDRQWLNIIFEDKIVIANIFETGEYVKTLNGSSHSRLNIITSIPVLLDAIKANSQATLAHFVKTDDDFFVEFLDKQSNKITEVNINVDLMDIPTFLLTCIHCKSEEFDEIGTMKGEDYSRLLYTTDYATSTKHGDPTNQIKFEISKSEITAVATDKIILAASTLPFNQTGKDYTFGLSLDAAQALDTMVAHDEDLQLIFKSTGEAAIIRVEMPADHSFFIFQSSSFDFDWHKVIPDESTVIKGPVLLSTQADKLYDYAGSVAVDMFPNSDGEKIFDIYINNMSKSITIKPERSREKIEPFTDISIKVYAYTHTFKIRVKSSYLLEALETFGERQVLICFSGERSAIEIFDSNYFSSDDKNKQVALFMPLKTDPEDWEDIEDEAEAIEEEEE